MDEYTQEYSRDCEPMRGGHTDNYYYQLASWVRRYKGVRPAPAAAGPEKIRIDGNLADWARVQPEFRDTVGDVIHREHKGYGNILYTNDTGRNDFVVLKAAYDKRNLYFFAQTLNKITPRTDKNWMLLLIDADLRLSKVHEVFGVSVGLGLSNVLQGTMTMPNVVQASDVGNLSLITAGATPDNPGDLLEADKFQSLIDAIEQDYDWIIVDSPPVMAVSDAMAMVPAVTGVVFVVGAQMTRQRAAEAALEQLDAAQAKILGAVLSRANVLEHSPYYNSSYVRYHNYHAAR